MRPLAATSGQERTRADNLANVERPGAVPEAATKLQRVAFHRNVLSSVALRSGCPQFANHPPAAWSRRPGRGRWVGGGETAVEKRRTMT